MDEVRSYEEALSPEERAWLDAGGELVPGLRSTVRLLEGLLTVRTASLVVRNPTHLAVAVRQETPGVWVYLFGGYDLLVLPIMDLALAHEVPCFHDPPLAQRIYQRGADAGKALPEPIADELYRKLENLDVC
jgi:flagellar biosynthesis protein FlhB